MCRHWTCDTKVNLWYLYSRRPKNISRYTTCSNKSLSSVRCSIRFVGKTRINSTNLIIKPTRCKNFSNLFWTETLHVSDSSSVHHQEFFTVHTAMVYVIQVCWQPTRCTDFSNLFLEWNSTCFGQFLCPSSGVFHCTYSNGICNTGLLTAN